MIPLPETVFNPTLTMSLWDVKSQVYHQARSKGPAGAIHRREMDNIRALLPSREYRRHLDIGTGTGISLSGLPAAQVSVCTDLSHPMLRRARVRGHHTSVQMDAGAGLPFGDDTFDLLTAIGIIEYLEDPRALLEESARVSVGGGLLLLTTAPPGAMTRLRALTGSPAKAHRTDRVNAWLRETGWRVVATRRSLLQRQWLVRRALGSE